MTTASKAKVTECGDSQAALATWRRLDRVFAHCLERTSLLHEWVLETSARGFVEAGADGTIINANRSLRELVPGWCSGRLAALFPEHEQSFIREALAGREGARQLRRMELNTGSCVVPVSIEFGPLPPGPSQAGGYAVIGNIDAFLRSERKMFEASDIGVIRIDRRARQIRFANPSAAALLGRHVTELEGTDPFELVTPESRGIRSSEVELECVRPDGTTAPVHLTIYPEFNELGTRIGSLTELRPLVERNAARAINEAIASHSSSSGLFGALIEE